MTATCVERASALVEAIRVDAAETDREGGFPAASIDLLRAAGLLRAPVPAQAGGASLGAAANTGELLETLAAVGSGSLVVGRLYEGHVNALQLVDRFATPPQRTRWQADAAAGHLFAVWNTQADDGVELVSVPGGYRLRGSKTFASGLGHVSRAIVTALHVDGERRGQRMVVLETDRQRPREDRSFWRPLGMRASASFRADMTDLDVVADALLGNVDDYYREPAFSGGAIRFAAVQQGGAEAVFDETRRFLRKAGRTGDAHQRARLGEMAWQVESGRLWLGGAARHAAAAMGAGMEPGDRDGERETVASTVAYAHLVRSAIEQTCLRVLALAERSVGARGLLRPEPFERLHRDLTHYLRQPAPDAALMSAGEHVSADPRSAAALVVLTGIAPSRIDVGAAFASRALAIAELGRLGTAMMFAPHADDESLGCGGLLAMLHDARVWRHARARERRLGVASALASLRQPPRAPRCASRNGTRLCRAWAWASPTEARLRLPDGAVPHEGDAGFIAAKSRCRALLVSHAPGLVVLPWRRDPHPDHRATHALVTAALADLRGDAAMSGIPGVGGRTCAAGRLAATGRSEGLASRHRRRAAEETRRDRSPSLAARRRLHRR